MARCLSLARRSLGRSWPNPPVGCVLVREGKRIASGRTAPGGRPHAEAEALAAAGAQARGSTAYVSLEPCSHFGRTPPCADALAEAGVARCVIAATDPDPRVSGRGAARLRERGVKVESGLLANAARELLSGHAARVERRRPWLTLKVAATLDGSVGAAGRRPRPITGERARACVEALRVEHDAVVTGIGTALADDPRLLPRNRGFARLAPVRVVLDPRLRLPVDSELVRSVGEAPLWLLHGPAAPPERREALAGAGVRLLEAPGVSGRPEIPAALEVLHECGISRAFAETGPKLSAALLREGCVDRLVWLSAGTLHGPGGLSAAEDAFPARLRLAEILRLGDDVASVWVPGG